MRLNLGFSKNTWLFIVSEVFYWGAAPVVTTFLTILVTTRVIGANFESVGFVLGVYWLVRSIFAFPIAYLTRKFSQDYKADIVAYVNFIIGLMIVLMAFSDQLWQVALIEGFLGILEGILYSFKWALYPRLIKKGNEEVGWGLHDTITSASTSLFAVFFGFVSDQYGLVILFIIVAMVYFIAGGVMYFIRIKHDSVVSESTTEKVIIKRKNK